MAGKNKPEKSEVIKELPEEGFGKVFGISERFALLNRLITRDLNNNTITPTFQKYTKDNISSYLANPYRYEKQLRDAVIYIYGASSHFRRLIQYFAGLTDLAYIISPHNIDPTKSVNTKSINRNYRKVLKAMTGMNVKTQLKNILKVCFREDIFYGYFWVTNDNITIQRLPSNYCAISSIEGNVYNVSFDFSYFDAHKNLIDNGYYPPEFATKYQEYQKEKNKRWVELDPPYAFAVKCNADISEYAVPPFAGLLREIYDIEDYKDLKLTKTALENYAMIVMNLPMNGDGEWLIDFDKAKDFWSNLDAVLPEEIGSVLSPMKVDKIGFEKSNTGDTDTVAESEQNLFTAAGVSSLLFNNEHASSSSLLLSIKADQAMTYDLVKNIEDAINRLLQSLSFGKNFKIDFLDCSPFNRKECGDAYLKACTYGAPMISYYCASQGLDQEQMESMNFLEQDVLGLTKKFVPLQSSTQMSSEDSKGATDEGGAPTKDIGEVSDSREDNKESEK